MHRCGLRGLTKARDDVLSVWPARTYEGSRGLTCVHLWGPRGFTSAREDVRVGLMDALQFEVQILCAFCVGLLMRKKQMSAKLSFDL